MKPLSKTFKRDQFQFTQIADLHPVYVYKKVKGVWTGFEVIIARQRGERVIKGVALEAAWAYPNNEDWGTYGWSCQTKERAFQKADELKLKAV